LDRTIAPQRFSTQPISGYFSMWSPQTKFTSPHLAIITIPSPQDWCLAPMITG
jgi:hypothetical protein